jgi:hypothetical protein
MLKAFEVFFDEIIKMTTPFQNYIIMIKQNIKFVKHKDQKCKIYPRRKRKNLKSKLVIKNFLRNRSEIFAPTGECLQFRRILGQLLNLWPINS